MNNTIHGSWFKRLSTNAWTRKIFTVEIMFSMFKRAASVAVSQNEVNDIRDEENSQSANSTSNFLRHKGKEIANQEYLNLSQYLKKTVDLKQASEGGLTGKDPVQLNSIGRKTKTDFKAIKRSYASLTQELEECKTNLDETSRALGEATSYRDSCLIELQNKQNKLEKYIAFNGRDD
ncbi:hypothetical protein Tco_0590030 [Tanacetum coccineum]